MNRNVHSLVSLTLLALVACGAPAEPLPDTDDAKLGYALGQSIARDLLEQGMDVSEQSVREGFEDGLAGRDPVLGEERLRSVLATFKQEIIADHPDEAFSGRRRRAEEAPFLAANAAREGVRVLDSGVQLEVLEVGDGGSPTLEDSVRLRYRSAMPSGQVIWDNLDGEPEVHEMKGLPLGLSEGLTHVKAGSRVYVVVPSNLAYTNFKMGPYARRAVAFELELVSVDRGDP